jgi:type IV pilus assembly protein PilX
MHNLPHPTLQQLHQVRRLRFCPQQRGAVLIISLIMLLVLSIIGVTGMRTTVLEEKMAGNMRDQNLAFQAAEAALRDGEGIVDSLVATSSFDGAAGRLGSADDDPDFFAASTWSDADSIAYSGTLDDVATQPRYILKYIGQIEGDSGPLDKGRGYGLRNTSTVNNFRVTARGTGASDTSQALLQAYFGKIM